MKGVQPAHEQPLRKLHERSKKYLQEWVDAPAHIHHAAYRMANPPLERPQSRKEFQQLLDCLGITDEATFLSEKFGFGVRTERNGDRLIIAWDAHTEYYAYQIWHIPRDRTTRLMFGPIAVPDFVFPLAPLGLRVNALDLLICPDSLAPTETMPELMGGPQVYGSRVFASGLRVVTSFTPDADGRERYLITAPQAETLRLDLSRIVDTIVWIENYYHLILLPMQAFGRGVDQIHDHEQRLLYQRAIITAQLESATPKTLEKWLNALSQEFLQVSRLAESMRYRLSASVPYDRIVRANVEALQEQPLPGFRPLTDYILGGITGVADGYQQLIRRLDALQGDFEATISVLRTRIELLLQDQNLALQDQNLKLLASVDKTTRSQAILQHTVEGLSIIVIAYYLSGLGNYVFKALHELGWPVNPALASGIFVPIAVGLSFGLMLLGRKFINKRMATERGEH